MRSDFVDLTGKRLNRWLVLSLSSSGRTVKWLCRCDCGKEKRVRGQHLKNGASRSCGCYAVDNHPTKHNATGTPEFMAWTSIKQRCGNIKNPSYKNYGGRGIKVCAEWEDSFSLFISDVGKRPSDKYSIDRIDNDKGYNKDNCKWSLRSEQNRNHRRNRWITYNGETLCITDWAKKIGITQHALQARFKAMSFNKAMTIGRLDRRVG